MDRRTRNQSGSPHPNPGRKRLIIVLSILGGLVLVAGLIAVGSVLYMRSLVRRLTDTQPMQLPVMELAKDEQQKVQRNLQRFVVACQKGQAERVEFDSRELNGIMAVLEGCRSLRGRAVVEIVDGVPWVQASIPLNDAGASWLRGRYLNGKLRLDVRLGEQGLAISVAEVVVPGGEVPNWILKRVQTMDLAPLAYQDATWGPRLRRLESLDFTGDRMVVQTRKGGP